MSDFMELVRTLSSSRNDPTERAEAAEALAELEDARSVSFLSGALDDRHFEVRDAAHRALFRVRPGVAILHAVERAASANPEDRRSAIAILIESPDDRAIECLIGVATDPEEDDEFRQQATAALGRVHHPRAGEALRELLTAEDTDVGVRRAVIEALGALTRAEEQREQVTFDEIRRIEDALADVVRREDEAPEVRAAAMTQHAGYRLWLPYLSAPDVTLRSAAARLMMEQDSYHGISDVRQMLLERIKLEKDPSIRGILAESIGAFGLMDAFDVLVDWLSDDVPEVRAGAALGLGRMGDADARPEIEGLRDDPDPAVREVVDRALRYLERAE